MGVWLYNRFLSPLKWNEFFFLYFHGVLRCIQLFVFDQSKRDRLRLLELGTYSYVDVDDKYDSKLNNTSSSLQT